MTPPRKQASPPERTSGSVGLRAVLAGAVALLAATAYWIHEPARKPAPPDAVTGPAPTPAPTPTRPRGAAEQASPAEQAAAPARQPWEVTRENTPPPPEGYVPAWKVKPPRPEAAQAPVPTPVEPPEPSRHRPAMDNPGGVNGDRPERPVPGLE